MEKNSTADSSELPPIARGETVLYQGKRYFYQPNGSSCYLYTKLEDVGHIGRHVFAPRFDSIQYPITEMQTALLDKPENFKPLPLSYLVPFAEIAQHWPWVNRDALKEEVARSEARRLEEITARNIRAAEVRLPLEALPHVPAVNWTTSDRSITQNVAFTSGFEFGNPAEILAMATELNGKSTTGASYPLGEVVKHAFNSVDPERVVTEKGTGTIMEPEDPHPMPPPAMNESTIAPESSTAPVITPAKLDPDINLVDLNPKADRIVFESAKDYSKPEKMSFSELVRRAKANAKKMFEQYAEKKAKEEAMLTAFCDRFRGQGLESILSRINLGPDAPMILTHTQKLTLIGLIGSVLMISDPWVYLADEDEEEEDMPDLENSDDEAINIKKHEYVLKKE